MMVIQLTPGGGGGATRPLPGDRARKNSTKTQQSARPARSAPEIKNGRSSAENGTPERLGCGTILEEVS